MPVAMVVGLLMKLVYSGSPAYVKGHQPLRQLAQGPWPMAPLSDIFTFEHFSLGVKKSGS